MRINQKGLKRSAAECHCLLFLPAEQSLEPCYSAALCPGVQLRHVRWGPARLRWCWPISACMDGWHVAGADSTTWAFCLLQNSSWGSFRFLLATDTDRRSSRCPVQLLYLSLRWLQGTVPFSSRVMTEVWLLSAFLSTWAAKLGTGIQHFTELVLLRVALIVSTAFDYRPLTCSKYTGNMKKSISIF